MKWITRARPKIDRVACPWLISRFIDAEAEFVFAAPGEVLALAEELGGIAFDVEGAVLSHRGELCSFDAILADYRLTEPSLADMAVIVRGADTDRLDLAPQAAGLLAVSLGLSRLALGDDHRMLAQGFVVYDALYEWLLHGRSERHGWNRVPGAAGGEPAWDTLRSGDVEIHVAVRRVLVAGRDVRLRRKEFSLLLCLAARPGRVLTRQFLLQHVWAYEKGVTSRTVDWHVAQLRAHLGAAGERIQTVHGVGYRWEAIAEDR